VLGFYLWIPPFYHAIVGETVHSTAQLPGKGSTPAPIVAETSFSNRKSGAEAIEDRLADNANRMVNADPFVHSTEVLAISSESLQTNPGSGGQCGATPAQFEVVAEGTSPTLCSERSQLAPGLQLSSTIIGVKRRAAYINHKLYFEGATIEYDGVTFELASVFPDKVVLRDGYRLVELKTAEPALLKHAELTPSFETRH